uniref:tRNA-binding domain-containing protein n=1 Tax=Globisporangium ultimum (strain ATCC 200006 / CBS 805.95 / DAOM BR144) TaxID=431595 RepID=K3W9Y0_GLOUD
MSGTAANQLEKLIADIETELGIDANTPIGKTKEAAPAAAASSEQKPKAKKEKGPKPVPAKKVADADQPEITKLDIRVGKIVKVWKHETADKLYCEEIDVGEDEPRQIASGLVYHYSLEEMQDRRILVLCNLKPRNLVGFKSHGMVMCAAVPIEGGKEKVAFVDPPADAKIGERIVFDGLTGEPYTPAQVEKKKVLVNIGEDMKTDASGVAKWKDHVFNTSAGPCTAPVANGVIR